MTTQTEDGECPVDILQRVASAAQDAVEELESGFFHGRSFDMLRDLLKCKSLDDLPTP